MVEQLEVFQLKVFCTLGISDRELQSLEKTRFTSDVLEEQCIVLYLFYL